MRLELWLGGLTASLNLQEGYPDQLVFPKLLVIISFPVTTGRFSLAVKTLSTSGKFFLVPFLLTLAEVVIIVLSGIS